MSRPVALVTGGSVRLGRAIAQRLARDGYDLVLHHRRVADAEVEEASQSCREAGAAVHLARADLAREDAPGALVAEALQKAGRLDLLVSSAALFWPTRGLEAAARDWDAFMAVNLKAPFLLSAACAPALTEARGAIVLMADIYASFPLKGYLPYTVSKAGVAMLTRSLALELAPHVRVNAVAPGYILPPPDGMDAEREQRLLARIPLGRHGESEDIAGAVSYLASAAYVTGQILAVDGGRTLNV